MLPCYSNNKVHTLIRVGNPDDWYTQNCPRHHHHHHHHQNVLASSVVVSHFSVLSKFLIVANSYKPLGCTVHSTPRLQNRHWHQHHHHHHQHHHHRHHHHYRHHHQKAKVIWCLIDASRTRNLGTGKNHPCTWNHHHLLIIINILPGHHHQQHYLSIIRSSSRLIIIICCWEYW